MLVNMKQMLEEARRGGWSVGFFNAVDVEMARAVIEMAEAMRAPVIVGTAEILLPAMSLERVAEYLIPMAKKASVPVAVHYDHDVAFAVFKGEVGGRKRVHLTACAGEENPGNMGMSHKHQLCLCCGKVRGRLLFVRDVFERFRGCEIAMCAQERLPVVYVWKRFEPRKIFI